MAGQQTPLVLLPRYTTYAGASTFLTLAMDVTEYSSASVNVWRGKLLGTDTPTVAFSLEESSDQVNWTACAGPKQGPRSVASSTRRRGAPHLKRTRRTWKYTPRAS